MALATLLRVGTLAGLFLAGVTLPGCDSGGESSIPQKTLAQATIYRDDWGVPHIVATLEESGFYALGYAQAEDQLESLLGSVYWARGQRAELQGESVLASDIEQRRWRHLQEGKEGLQRLKPQVLENYRAFVAGVHRYMDDHPAQVPAWAPDLEVSDLLTISRAVFWVGYAAVLGPAECEEPEVQLQASIKEAAGMQISGASNGWVVAPPRTHTGAVILLADPHTELQNAAYYEYRMDAGNLKSSGFALGPLLWQANNEQVSWAMTTGNPDLWDCYAVEVDPDQPSRYRYDGEWQEMIRAEESFGIKAGDSVTRVFEYTRHNGVLSPVVSRTGNTAYVVSVSQMHDTGLLDNEIWRMNHAASVLELRDAMSMLGMFPQNIVAGDTSGNIWYLRAGKTPIRPTGYNWRQVVPGNSSDTAWQGFYEIEDMIQVLNPPQNYLQNNNVAPDRLFGDVNLEAADYPEALFYDTPGRMTSRGLRTLEILHAAADFTIGQAMELAFDETWVTTEYWQMALRFALQTYPEWLENQSKEVAALVERILNFDGVASAESEAALNFYYWRNGMKAVLDRPQFNHLRSLPWSLEDFDPEFAAAILDQAETAAAQMVDELGGTQRSLGSVFRVGRDEASWPVGGETIDVPEEVDCLADFSPLCERTMRAFASGPPDANGERRAYRGSHAMRLVELSRPVRAWTLHLHGQSSHPDSPHYDDQDRLASERKFKPAYFSWNELQGHIESTTMLEWDPAAQ